MIPLKFVRWLIHIPALFLSLIMVIDTLAGISIDPFWKIFFIGCAIYAELFGQFVRGLAAAYRKNNQGGKAFLCWLLVGVYIAGFAGVSAVGVFITKVSTEDQIISANTDNQTIAKDNYERTNTELNNKIADQTTEFNKNHGKGKNYDSIGEDIKVLKKDLVKYEGQLNKANKVIIKTNRSIFSYLPVVVRIPLFCVIMFVIYTGLLLTPWPINLKTLHNEVEMSGKVTLPIICETDKQNFVTPVTDEVLHEKICQICGKTFPATRDDAKFCGVNCRVQAHRNNLVPKEI